MKSVVPKAMDSLVKNKTHSRKNRVISVIHTKGEGNDQILERRTGLKCYGHAYLRLSETLTNRMAQ